jgi:hypothetical protein
LTENFIYEICVYLSIRINKNESKIILEHNCHKYFKLSNTLYLERIVSIKTSISNFDLSRNNLGENENCIIKLKEILIINKSIKTLNLP